MRSVLTLILLVLCLLVTPARAAAEDGGMFSTVTLSAKATYASKYIWRGYDIWNDNPAFQPDVSLDFNGLYAGIWSSYSTAQGCADPFGDVCSSWDEHDYYGGIYGALWDGSPGSVEYDISYTYFQFFRLEGVDTHEILLNVTHPALLKGLAETPPVLYWGFAYGKPVNETSPVSQWVKAGLKMPFSLFDIGGTALAEAFWDDGAGSFGAPAGVSHIKTGVFFELKTASFSIKPSLFYQQAQKNTDPSSLLDSEFWFELQLGYSMPVK